MNAMEYLLSFPWVEPLGWTLVHFLWQGALIGGIAAILLRAMSRSTSQVRYLVACGLLSLCVVLPLITFLVLARPPLIFGTGPKVYGNASIPVLSSPNPTFSGDSQAKKKEPVKPGLSGGQDTLAVTAAPEKSFLGKGQIFLIHLANEWVPWIVPLWLAGVLGMGVRMGTGWIRIQFWRRTSRPLADTGILDSLERLSTRIGITKKVRLLISDRIPGPITLGWFKPVVLIPAQVLTGLSRQELEAILAHELGHIVRHDYLVNLVQSAMEVFWFYHPAVWWLSGQIREIREECCDELALELGADRLVYAKALAGLAERQLYSEPALASTGGSLLNRISRLLGQPREEGARTRGYAAWMLALAGAFSITCGVLYSAKFMANTNDSVANTKAAPSGQVVDPSGNPVAGARVQLYFLLSPWGLGNRVVEEVKTDARGHFAFTRPLTFKVPHGTERHDHYTILADRDGFAPAWTQILGGTPEQKSVTLSLTPPVSQTFEVVDIKGQPVAGAQVWLRYAGKQANKVPFFAENLSVPQDLGISQAVTDASGRATIDNLPDTIRGMAASKEGFEDATGCTTPPNGLPRFTLKPEGVLEGQVTDPLGLPAEGVTVWLYPKFRWNQYFMAKTGKDGRYRIDKIWSNGQEKDWGHYEVGIRDGRFAASTRDVAFSSGQSITGFDFKTASGTEIKGTLLDPVTQKPVAGGEVYIDSSCGRQARWTDLNGQFRCRVPEGMVDVFFGLPPGGTYVLEERSTRGRTSRETRAFGKEMSVVLNTTGELGPLGTMHGQIVDTAGKPVPYGPVSASVKGGTYIRTTGWSGSVFPKVYSDAGGRFVMTLPVGLDYAVTAENSGGGQSGSLAVRFASDPYDMPDPVRLQPTRAADLVLTDLSGAPRRGFKVTVTPQIDGADQWLSQKEYTTDADGHLHLDNINLDFTYRISPEKPVNSWNIFDPKKQVAAGKPYTLMITDHYVLRLEDGEGRTLPVQTIKEFFVWILDDGKRIRWTDRLPERLEKWGDGVLLARSTISLGRPGDVVDMLLETSDGKLVRAQGTLPTENSAILLAKVREMESPDYAADPKLPVQPDEVAGRVVDMDGKPVVDATITFNGAYWTLDGSVNNGSGELAQPEFKTDREGVFRVSKIQEKGFYYETVFKEGYAPVFIADLPIGQGFIVKLQNNTRLAGTVGGGKPGKVKLLLEKDKDTRRQRNGFRVRGIKFRTETDESGRYDFPMEPGTYRFKAVSSDACFASGEVTVEAGKTASIPAVLEPGFPVTFRLADSRTGKPVSGIELGIMEERFDHIYQVKEGSKRISDEKGEVHWDNLMPGRTQFTSLKMSHGFAGEQSPYSRWGLAESQEGKGNDFFAKGGLSGSSGVQDLYLEVKESLAPVQVVVEKGVQISGTVLGPAGEPQKGVAVGVVPSGGYSDTLTGDSRYTLMTNEQGEFKGYIPAGNGVVYNLCAYYYPERPPGSFDPAPLANAVSEPFSSKPGDELIFHLKMPRGAWVTGKLTGPDGKPAGGSRVTATHEDRMDVAYGKRIAVADKEGNFRLGPLRPGRYSVQAGFGQGTPLRLREADTDKSKGVELVDGQQIDVGSLPAAFGDN